MNFNLFQSSNNNNQLGQSPLDFMSDDDGELDFSAVMQQELESHDLLLMQSEAAAHHHPLSPPTVIIPSSSSNNINNNCAATDDGDLYKSNVLASVGDHQNMMFPLNFLGGNHTTPHVNTTTSNDQQQHSPRTPRLNLDAASVLQSWLLILDNTITNNNNNNNINNNNHNSSTTTPIHNNNNNNLNLNNNNNNINLNNINHHTTYNNTTSDQNLQDTLENLIQNNKHRQQIHDMLTNNNNNNNSSNTTTSMQSQSYLGSVLANCTSIHSPNMRSTMNQRNHSHQHSKSPSFGSGNYNSKLNSGVRKASSQRSNSTSCFQSIQSYTASKMHLAAASATSMMNMNGGLNSPSVASTCSSNLTMSPANVSTNSFNQLINNNNNGHMGYMSNSNSNNNSSATVGSSSNQQYSPIVTNQQMVAAATVSGSNKKGKLPANRPVVDKNSNNQFTFVNSQHSKGLLVEANPNDKPIKMQQCKIVDGGIKIQIEDGISKNKKDTGLQFHTCTFK